MADAHTSKARTREPVSLKDCTELAQTFVAEAETLLAQISSDLKRLRETPGDADALQRVFGSFHTIKGSAGFIGMVDIVDVAHETEFLLEAMLQRKSLASPQVVDALSKSRKILQEMSNAVHHALRKGTSVPVNPKVPKHLDSLRGQLMTVLLTSRIHEEQAPRSSGPAARPAQPSSDPKRQADLAEQSATAQWLGQQADLLDVHQQLGTLQDMVRDMAPQPFKSFRSAVEATIEQCCERSGKSAQLAFTGGDIEVPATYLDVLRCALQHLVRNAVVHGIDGRGTIIVCAQSDAQGFTVRVEDDGKGLDLMALRKVAKRFHMIESPETQDAQDLIFLPGLSTVSDVTPDAGRGIGLDAVRRAVRSVGGRIEVSSGPRRGTTFELKFPATL